MARRLLLALIPLSLFAASVVGIAGAAQAYPTGEEWPTLMLGSRGADVEALHYLLTRRGYPCSGSVFNTTTDSQVRAFQAASGLYPIDGIVGPNTWGRLYVVVYPRDPPYQSGEEVEALQSLLNAKRFTNLQSGYYDATTQGAVRTFQGHMSVTVDGVVGFYTWRNLLWHYQRLTAQNTYQCLVPDYWDVGRIWGVASARGWFSRTSYLFFQDWGVKVAFQDLSLEHGGDISDHGTHERGMDLDVELVKLSGNQCGLPFAHINAGGNWNWVATRGLIWDVFEATGAQSPNGGWVERVLFGDQTTVDYFNVYFPDRMQWDSGTVHDNHLHVTYCVVYYPASTTPGYVYPSGANYDC